jgi:SAM-dependent methyltransferase
VSSSLDRINKSVWASPRTLDLFVRRDGWIDQGEALVMDRVAGEARGQPILDLGVGGGRTTPYLLSVSDDYVAVDYLAEMVSLTRSRYPGVRVERMDARALSALADNAFGLVVFSCNGIDGVDHEGRRRIIAEVRRVLRPGGLFAYSTHNLDHRLVARPRLEPDWRRLSHNPLRVIRHLVRLPEKIRTYRRARDLAVRGDDWAVLPHPGYDFSVMVSHYVSLDEALREVREAGFEPEVEIYAASGSRLDPGDDTSGSPRFHLVARKPWP